MSCQSFDVQAVEMHLTGVSLSIDLSVAAPGCQKYEEIQRSSIANPNNFFPILFDALWEDNVSKQINFLSSFSIKKFVKLSLG